MAVRQQCIKLRTQPGWADVEGAGGRKAAIVLVFSGASDMAEEWVGGEVSKGRVVGSVGNLTATS